MDQYIYKPPPPPPPPGGQSQSGGSRGPPGRERGPSRNSNQRHKPYQRPGHNKSAEEPVLISTAQIPRTPEEIAKWIEERRKKWPSARRIAEKEEEKKKATELSSKFEQSQPPQEPSTISGPSTSGKSNAGNNSGKHGMCKFFLKGKCRHGDRCKYAHRGDGRGALPKRFEAPDAKESLYKRLVQVDIDSQDVPVLSFITFLRNKGVI